VTAVVEERKTTPPDIPNAAPVRPGAPWHLRAWAFVVDLVPGAVVVATMALVVLTVPVRGVWWWSCGVVAGLVILWMLVNRLLLPAAIGWSLGRANVNIAVVRRDGTAVGPWRLLVRELAHCLDTASLFVGWLWPLWDRRRRTFADLLVGTEVRVVEQPAPPERVRRLNTVLVLAATSLCLIGAATSFAAVYWHQRAVQQASKQIRAQGPKMVVDMLSYDPKTMRDDFARAQSLTTDKYRPQLIKQQETVQKHPVLNQYFVTNDAVLGSPTPDHASMLLFLRGERGPAAEQRYITATVRVSFAKATNGHWRIDDLTVVTKPKPAAGGK
jgi:Mce-associated membrane protein